MPKCEQTVADQRTTEVLQLILQGAEFNEIRQYAANRGWDLSARQLRRYIRAAYRSATHILNQKREEFLSRHLLQRRALYARCLKAEDLRTALAGPARRRPITWYLPTEEDRSHIT